MKKSKKKADIVNEMDLEKNKSAEKIIDSDDSREVVDELENKIESNEGVEEIQETKQDDMTTKLLRLQADFLNYRNRVEKEKFRLYTTGVEDTIIEILPILDNFERAVKSSDEIGDFKDGIQMILTQFKQTLEKKGLEEIDALGTKFDPALHHGVAVGEEEGTEADIVIEVFQKGYKLKDKVLRPSMVKVSR